MPRDEEGNIKRVNQTEYETIRSTRSMANWKENTPIKKGTYYSAVNNCCHSGTSGVQIFEENPETWILHKISLVAIC